MTLIERINYYAKAVAAIIGGLVTFIALIVAATKDGNIDGGDISVLVTGLFTYIGTVIAVIKSKNTDPSELTYDTRN
jgi:ABC-type enterobactin transport system permease subunit